MIAASSWPQQCAVGESQWVSWDVQAARKGARGEAWVLAGCRQGRVSSLLWKLRGWNRWLPWGYSTQKSSEDLEGTESAIISRLSGSHLCDLCVWLSHLGPGGLHTGERQLQGTRGRSPWGAWNTRTPPPLWWVGSDAMTTGTTPRLPLLVEAEN